MSSKAVAKAARPEADAQPLTRANLVRAVLLLWLTALCAFAQLPTSDILSDADRPPFDAEVTRLEALLTSAPDQAAVTYQIARTLASAKQWPETIEWLRKVAAMKVGLDPSHDSLFASLNGSKEFSAILSAVREATPPVSHSKQAFTIAEGDLSPESMAYDPKGGRFYFGSMRKGKLLRCSSSGDCTPFAVGLGTVLGIKVHGDGLWVLNNSEQESALIHYDLASGAVLRKYSTGGPGHLFNDLAIQPDGVIYLTDTRAGAVWHLAKGGANLTKLPGRFEFANGIALSSGGELLYVSTFPDGITVVDLKTGAASPIVRPGGLCLATIDGLYFHRGALIAIQNGFMSPRVVQMILTRDMRSISRLNVLERRNALFDGITTGVIVGNEFLYMANVQDDKKTGFEPIAILKTHL